jgi:hypothetical protein
MWFTEPLEVDFSSAKVVDKSGKQWDNADFHIHGDPTNPGITMQPGATNGIADRALGTWTTTALQAGDGTKVLTGAIFRAAGNGGWCTVGLLAG